MLNYNNNNKKSRNKLGSYQTQYGADKHVRIVSATARTVKAEAGDD